MTHRIVITRGSKQGDGVSATVRFHFQFYTVKPAGAILTAVGSFMVNSPEVQAQLLHTEIHGIGVSSIQGILTVQLFATAAYFAMREAKMANVLGQEFTYETTITLGDFLATFSQQAVADDQESN